MIESASPTHLAVGAAPAPVAVLDVRPELLRSLSPYLVGATASVVILGLYDRWDSGDFRLLLVALTTLYVAGGVLVAFLTRGWRNQIALRSTQGLWFWLGATVILLATGGYSSEFWLLFLFGAVVSGVMCDRTGTFINVSLASVAFVAPNLATGIDSHTAISIGMRLLMLLFVSIVVEIAAGQLLTARNKHEQAERALREANVKLNASVSRMQRHEKDSKLLAEMGQMLQVVGSTKEMDEVIATYVHQLFPAQTGAMFVYSSSRDALEARVTWGHFPEGHAARVIRPEDCRALRMGNIYRQVREGPNLPCPHAKSTASSDTICVPMIAYGDVIGLLHVRISAVDSTRVGGTEDDLERASALALPVAEYVSLALANHRLRESLRNQAIRDGLTGLFNRRFAEETLHREIERAQRGRANLTVIMADIDHFKLVNDTFGHDAGDFVLQRIGMLLKTRMRGHDVACRYGGEEFLAVLAETSSDVAWQRADSLRQEIKALDLVYEGRTIAVTVSFGIAVFPEHGANAAGLLRAADAALYSAKNNGRDRVAIADAPSLSAKVDLVPHADDESERFSPSAL